jgi:hypothetical protein
MNSRAKLIAAVILLVVCGGGLAAHKVRNLGVPFWIGERVEEWMVEARVSLLALDREVKVRLSLPSIAIESGTGQEAGSLGYNYFIEKERGEFTAVWSSGMRQGSQALYFRVRFLPGSVGTDGPLTVQGPPPQAESPGLSGALGEAAAIIVNRAKSLSADPDSLFVALLEELQRGQPSQELLLVKRHYEQEHRGANALLAMATDLLGLAGIPARIAYGVLLDEERVGQSPVPLLEYYDGAYWKVRNPTAPGNIIDGRAMFVWHRGGGPLLDVTGGENSRVSFTVVKDRIPLSRLTDLRESPFLISTILGLPASERAVFRYIVLIPLGAFIVVLMRNLVGVPTLGTFMPVLLALALLEIDPVRGLVMFGILIAAGLWFRFLLSRLNLLVVPRVAACVVIVTLLMILMTVISYHLGIGGGAQITLFPMIILAWTIERMSLIWEEEGKRSAISQVSGSVLVAVVAFYFMKVEQIQYWAFYFPELLLVLLAGILLIGRYTGYRISELFRFRGFAAAPA